MLHQAASSSQATTSGAMKRSSGRTPRDRRDMLQDETVVSNSARMSYSEPLPIVARRQRSSSAQTRSRTSSRLTAAVAQPRTSRAVQQHIPARVHFRKDSFGETSSLVSFGYVASSIVPSVVPSKEDSREPSKSRERKAPALREGSSARNACQPDANPCENDDLYFQSKKVIDGKISIMKLKCSFRRQGPCLHCLPVHRPEQAFIR